MKKFILWVLLAVFLSLPCMVFAVNTFNDTQLPTAFQITVLDTAWTWTDHFTSGRDARGIKVDYIVFRPGAVGDIVTIHDTNAAGPVIAPFVAEDLAGQIIYIGGAMIRPYLAAPAGAVNAAAYITIRLSDDN